VRSRRNKHRGLAARAAAAAGLLALRICAQAARRPVDSFAVLAALTLSLMIIVNAAFLQAGAHRAPFLANPAPPAASHNHVTHSEPTVRPHRDLATHVVQHVAAPRDDPIAKLIGPSPRIREVQRVLSDYGYGQIKPSGFLDEATSTAIERFEREHKLPLTGLVSDGLVRELAAMTGRPLR
jgi:Putative peptidoglycan binding domain